MIVGMNPAKCDECGQDMALAPAIGDGHTTSDGRPYDWLCLEGHRKFARHLNDDEIKAIGEQKGKEIIAKLEQEKGKTLIDMQEDALAKEILVRQEAIDQANNQRAYKLGQAQGAAMAYQGLLEMMAGKKKRTVPKKDIEDRLRLMKTAIENANVNAS